MLINNSLKKNQYVHVGSFKPEGAPIFNGIPKPIKPSVRDLYIQRGWGFSKMRVYSIQPRVVRGVKPIGNRIQNESNRFINKIFKKNDNSNKKNQ